MFVFCTGFLNFMEYMIIIVYFDFKLQVDTASCRLVAASRGGSNNTYIICESDKHWTKSEIQI